MSAQDIDFIVRPSHNEKVTYLALPGASPDDGECYQLSFQVEFHNSSATATYRVNLLRISFPAGSGIGHKDITISRYLPNDQTAPDLILGPLDTQRPVDFKNTDNFVLTRTPPDTITFQAFIDGSNTPRTRTFPLARATAPVASASYAWPWHQSDLNQGEYWTGIGADHCCGPQLYAHDFGLQHFDSVRKTWSELRDDREDTSVNENYRIWNKRVHAIADGVVFKSHDLYDDVPDLPGVPAFGNHFIIDHGTDRVHYCHLQRGTLDPHLFQGKSVKRGQFLGRVGNSGHSSQPHLHMHAIDKDTGMLRPLVWNAKMVATLEAGRRARGWRLSQHQGLPTVYSLIYPGNLPPADDQEWSGWKHLGGDTLYGPAVASWGPRRLDLFAIGVNNDLRHKWFDGDRWHDWESLGGQLNARPTAVSWGPNRIDVFARGTNHELWHIWWDGSRWHDWQSLGGTWLSAPAVSSRRENHLDVFIVATDKTMWHIVWHDNGWSNWESLAGQLTADPSAASWSHNRIDTFVRGTNGMLWHRWWRDSWSDWENQNRPIEFGPAVCSRVAGHLDVFAVAPDGAVIHECWDHDKWVHWESLGGKLTDGPAAASWSENRIDVFGRGTDGAVYHKVWKA